MLPRKAIAIDAYLAGNTCREAAQIAGLSVSRVRSYVGEAGISRPVGRPRKTNHKGTAGQSNKRCREFQVKRKTPAERAHHDRVAQMGCLVCGARPVEVHHVVGYADKPGRLPKDHRRVVPLCFAHHSVQGGREAVHTLGHRGFYERHGIDLLAEAERLWND